MDDFVIGLHEPADQKGYHPQQGDQRGGDNVWVNPRLLDRRDFVEDEEQDRADASPDDGASNSDQDRCQYGDDDDPERDPAAAKVEPGETDGDDGEDAQQVGWQFRVGQLPADDDGTNADEGEQGDDEPCLIALE